MFIWTSLWQMQWDYNMMLTNPVHFVEWQMSWVTPQSTGVDLKIGKNVNSDWLQKCLISIYHQNSKQVVQRLHEMRTRITDWKWFCKATLQFLRRCAHGLGAGSPQVLRILLSDRTQGMKVYHSSGWETGHLSTQLSSYRYIR